MDDKFVDIRYIRIGLASFHLFVDLYYICDISILCAIAVRRHWPSRKYTEWAVGLRRPCRSRPWMIPLPADDQAVLSVGREMRQKVALEYQGRHQRTQNCQLHPYLLGAADFSLKGHCSSSAARER